MDLSKLGNVTILLRKALDSGEDITFDCGCRPYSLIGHGASSSV